MNILRTDIDAVNALLTIQVSEADYAGNYQKALKQFRKKANFPGFRPGMAPMSMVTKMYGRGVKADEINKLLQNELYKYINENKLDVLGEPLPNEEDEKREMDFAVDKDFEFKFDIALAPEFELSINKKDSINVYDIEVTDEMIEAQVNNYADRFGSQEEVEAAQDAKDMLKGTLYQLNEEGKVVEGGVMVEDAVMASQYMADDEQKALFADAKKNSVIVFNPRKAYNNDAEIASMLKLTKEQAAEVNYDLQFEIKSIVHFTRATLDKALFDKVYPNANIETIEDFRVKVAQGIKQSYNDDTEYKFGLDARAAMVKKMDKLTFPEATLKRWYKLTDDKLTDEQVEQNFPEMMQDLKWYIFRGKVVKENDLKVEKEDIDAYARKMTRIQFAQYGMTDIPDELLDNYASGMLKKQETVQRIAENVLDDKAYAVIKSKVKTVDTPISVADFNKLFETK